MKFARFDDDRVGIVVDAGIVDATAELTGLGMRRPDLMTGLIAEFAGYRSRLDHLARTAPPMPLSSVTIRSPLPRPGNIDCMARNYIEDGNRENMPEINAFHKTPNAVIGPGDVMVLPDIPARVFEGEAEFAVVIGKRAAGVAAADAMEHVFGFVNFIDGSARGLPTPDNVFYQSKCRDTFAPIGPYVVTADEIPDPHDLRVRLWVNGQLRQDFNSRDLAYRIPSCIEWISSIHTLEPGDLVATGTHHGGLSALHDGDTVELETEGLGRLRIAVRDDLKRTWSRETRAERKAMGHKVTTAPQFTGKYAATA